MRYNETQPSASATRKFGSSGFRSLSFRSGSLSDCQEIARNPQLHLVPDVAIILEKREKFENMGETREEFKVPLDTAVFTTKFVLDDKKTITYVTHNIEDGAWQFFSDDSFENFEEVAKIVGLQEIFEMDNSLFEIADLPLGFCVTRKDKWTIKKDK